MTRGATTTAVMLALLTGLVLGQIGTLALRADAPERTGSDPSPRALATAHSFYDGMNRLLTSGDRSIETAVAPGFTDHTSNGQGDRTLPEMIDWLLAMRATFPYLQVKVLDLEQRDELIAVHLEIDPGTPSPIPGIPLMSPPASQSLEFLRVEGIAVTDRWGAGTQLPVATLSVGSDFAWNTPGLVIPAIEHVALAPGHSLQLPFAGPVILGVESGRVQLDQAGTDLNGSGHPRLEPLASGQIRVMNGDGAVGLRTVSSDPAELWAFTTNRSSPSEPASGDTTAAPANRRTLAFLPLLLSSDLLGPQRIAIVRISLPSGTVVAPHTPGVIEEIAVLDGALDVIVSNGRALKCTDNTALPFEGAETIAAGEGVSAKGTASLGYRVAGPQPATLLIMRIEPLPSSPSPYSQPSFSPKLSTRS